MKFNLKTGSRRASSLLMAAIICLGLVPSAFAQPSNTYTDPAKHWMTSSGRTAELDVNAVVTEETFWCSDCREYRSFLVYRVPEYTANGESNLTRNVLYSDGIMVDNETKGSLLLASPKDGGIYTGYHWTKAVCQTCGRLNSNWGSPNAYSGPDHDHGYGNAVYKLYDCSPNFFEALPNTVSYQYADSTYHTKTTHSGDYCQFCYGTHNTQKSELERHNMNLTIVPQLGHQRFVVKDTCEDCGYSVTSYVGAKSVVANYYGEADGKAHTLTVSDLSETGVKTSIRYGNSAEDCNLTTAPSFTEPGQYTVYYEITYTYKSESMTENGVAYVWLRESVSSSPDCSDSSAKTSSHDYTFVETVAPTCSTPGFDRYVCKKCGTIETRNFTRELSHTYKTIVIRDADCENEGKALKVCTCCNETIEVSTPKGEHSYKTYKVPATCTTPGYTVKECTVCGEKTITDITAVLKHSYKSITTPATCETGGHTQHICTACGESYVDHFTDPLSHNWNQGEVITKPSCTGEGVTQHTCQNCGATKVETIPATGHTPGEDATCTNPQTCTACGAIVHKAIGHDFAKQITPATCTEMGYTTYTCQHCGLSYKSDYTNPLGHDYKAMVTPPTCTEGGYTTYTCTHCGESYVDNYTDALGHQFGAGKKVLDSVCSHDGVMEYDCTRCSYHELHAISATGHTPGEDATCTTPQVCTECGAVLAQAKGHSYAKEVIAPSCTEMGYTIFTCMDCGKTYKADYTDALGHKAGEWMIDREPTTQDEGSKHRECIHCGDVMDSAVIERLYLTSITDARGEAVVDGFMVIVTDTDSKNPVANATVTLNADGSLSIRLPDGRLLDYADQSTVTVLLMKGKTPVTDILVVVTDKNDNYSSDKTDTNGQITVPSAKGSTGEEGRSTDGITDADGNDATFTIRVLDAETGRPIEGATVTIGKTGNITVVLPDGTDMDANNRITVVVTDNRKNPIEDQTVIIKADNGKSATGETNDKGQTTVPAVTEKEKHGAYIIGYPDGTFRPERGMTRAEATAIFARLLAEQFGDSIRDTAKTKFTDVEANDWFSGYVAYLTREGVATGYKDDSYRPDEAITRSEFVALAVRFFEAYGAGCAEIMEQYADFGDVSDGYWAAGYIEDAAIHGWVKGYGDGSFRGDNDISRAEVVTIVNRLLDRAADENYIANNLRKLNTFSDMSAKHWAYYDVMESANAHTAVLDGGESWQSGKAA